MDQGADSWLDGEVISMYDGAERGFVPEIDRVVDVLGHDRTWLHWWRSVSKAPALELLVFVTRPPRSAYSAETTINIGADERVVRGRRRHQVRLHVDVDDLGALEPDERRLRALPIVLDGIERVRLLLDLGSTLPPAVPAGARPRPLNEATLRRRRLRELLEARTESTN